MRDNVERGGHAPCPLFAASRIAAIRTDEMDAAILQARQIILCRRMRPHRRIHRWCHHHRRRCCQQNRARQIIGNAGNGARHQIGRGRHNKHKIGFAGKADMSHLGFVSERKQIGIDLFTGQSRQAERGDELLCRTRHNAGDMKAVILQTAGELERFIGSDAAADNQGDPVAVGGWR